VQQINGQTLMQYLAIGSFSIHSSKNSRKCILSMVAVLQLNCSEDKVQTYIFCSMPKYKEKVLIVGRLHTKIDVLWFICFVQKINDG